MSTQGHAALHVVIISITMTSTISAWAAKLRWLENYFRHKAHMPIHNHFWLVWAILTINPIIPAFFSDCGKSECDHGHTGLTHHFYFLTFGHSGAQS